MTATVAFTFAQIDVNVAALAEFFSEADPKFAINEDGEWLRNGDDSHVSGS